jgi:hypothetical protein
MRHAIYDKECIKFLTQQQTLLKARIKYLENQIMEIKQELLVCQNLKTVCNIYHLKKKELTELQRIYKNRNLRITSSLADS